ncbi:MAG: tetratricopeptide repeat protein [bacterium]|jgi:Flp pilus assembly protein TadD
MFDGAQFCKDCGYSLTDENTNTPRQDEVVSESEVDFVVTESGHTSAPELIGLDRKKDLKSDDEEFEIKSTASLLDDEAVTPDAATTPFKGENDLIGESAPPIPPVVAATDELKKPAETAEQSKDKEKKDFKKLSQEELEAVNRNLYGPHVPEGKQAKSTSERGELSEKLRKNIDELTERQKANEGGIKAIDDPAQNGAVLKTHKVRGVAFYRKNFIQIVGNPYLHNGDELTVNEKTYILREKKISRNMAIGIFTGILAVVLVIVGLQLINPTISGEGEIVGMLLDENRQPVLEKSRISIPSLNKTTTTNAQGFFRFDLVPTGTYEIVYELGDRYTGKGNATVTSGQTTLMTFGFSEGRQVASSIRTETTARSAQQQNSASQPPTRATQQTTSSASNKSQPSYGSIKLAANVTDARLSVDDRILGSGNVIYGRIPVGRHRVKVERQGYAEYSTVVDIDSDQIVTVTANLTPQSRAAETGTADSHMSKGNAAFAEKNYAKAIAEYSKALEISPNLKEAYAKRAEAYGKNGNSEAAAVDYIRLGEIYRVAKNNVKAINAFTSALAYQPKDKIALVGRGGARLDNGDYRPALIDYEEALKIDNQFYPALLGGGMAHFRLGNNKQADKYFKNAYKLNQSDPYLFQNMMLNYLALDDIKNIRKIYAEYKTVASPSELAEFKTSSRYEPVMRLIKEEDR